jgi:hypothetical protein
LSLFSSKMYHYQLSQESNIFNSGQGAHILVNGSKCNSSSGQKKNWSEKNVSISYILVIRIWMPQNYTS